MRGLRTRQARRPRCLGDRTRAPRTGYALRGRQFFGGRRSSRGGWDLFGSEPENLCVSAEPGVTLTELNEQLSAYGVFFSIDLGADASLGGMAGTNASGSNALRYGDMREQVLGMEVVLSDGRIIQVGSKAHKTSSGYDLKSLLVGSEGTLGIVTRLTIKVQPLPAHRE